MPSKDGQPTILTPLQSKFLKALFEDPWFQRHFYLTGGTALSAYHLFHRYSDDLDFFCHGMELNPIHNLLLNTAKNLGHTIERTQTSPGFMRYLANKELKIDFVTDVDFRVGSPELIDGMMIDNIKNIAVNKVCAILGRLDAKDYVDLYTIFKQKHFDIFELLELGQKKDAGLNEFTWASVIADVQTLELMPRLIKPISQKELISFFLSLRDIVLDKIKPNT